MLLCWRGCRRPTAKLLGTVGMAFAARRGGCSGDSSCCWWLLCCNPRPAGVVAGKRGHVASTAASTIITAAAAPATCKPPVQPTTCQVLSAISTSPTCTSGLQAATEITACMVAANCRLHVQLAQCIYTAALSSAADRCRRTLCSAAVRQQLIIQVPAVRLGCSSRPACCGTPAASCKQHAQNMRDTGLDTSATQMFKFCNTVGRLDSGE
jgi:hypothetical protein